MRCLLVLCVIVVTCTSVVANVIPEGAISNTAGWMKDVCFDNKEIKRQVGEQWNVKVTDGVHKTCYCKTDEVSEMTGVECILNGCKTKTSEYVRIGQEKGDCMCVKGPARVYAPRYFECVKPKGCMTKDGVYVKKGDKQGDCVCVVLHFKNFGIHTTEYRCEKSLCPLGKVVGDKWEEPIHGGGGANVTCVCDKMDNGAHAYACVTGMSSKLKEE